MGKRRPKQPPHEQPAQPSLNTPFAGLKGVREVLPAGEPPAAAPAAAGNAPPRAPTRAVIRYQRKGRGGKETTLVEKLGISPSELDTWLKDLKRELGCGGSVEGAAIALQGDQRARLPKWLERRGVARISTS